jgi:hypothetical protein
MQFATRWPESMAIAELAFAEAPQPGQVELGHFEKENDAIFAEPLMKRIDEQSAIPA